LASGGALLSGGYRCSAALQAAYRRLGVGKMSSVSTVLFPEVRSHFQSARSQALSYLLTVGAKAIVLASTTTDRTVIFRGLDQELAVKEGMMREEEVRKLRRRLADKQGVPISKRARNGVVRKLNVRIRHYNGVSCLQWRASSFPYRKKYFPLDTVIDVTILNPHHDDKISFDGKAAHRLPYCCVRIRNGDRELDVGFETLIEADAFMVLVQSNWIAKDFSESMSYMSNSTYPSDDAKP